MITDPIAQFADAIRAAGLTVPERIEADGMLHRFASNGDRSDDAGYYVLHLDGIPAGHFGCWRAGVKESWYASIGRHLSPAEVDTLARKRADAERERTEEKARRHAEARERAASMWAAATPASAENPYLRAKGVKPHGIRERDGELLIPMRDGTGELHSLQRIAADGDKRYLTGGRVKACYHAMGTPNGAICIAEGYATGASIHEATGHAVAVAFSKGNLKPVAHELHAKYPDAKLTLCADDDYQTAGNPGITKATEAARAVGGFVAVPDFGAERPEDANDFNDLARHLGEEAVQRCVANARDQAGAQSATAGDSVGDDWSEPRPLPDSLLPVAAFDMALLPDTLRPWIEDIADRVQCAPDFVGVAAMAALGAVIGRKVAIRPQAHTDWTEVANQWALIVGRPGVLKSPAIEQALAPLRRLEARANEEYDGAIQKFKVERLAQELRESANKKRAAKALHANAKADLSAFIETDEVAMPVCRRYRTNDTTAASLGELHRQNPNGLLVHRDELVSLLRDLDQEENASARGFYLTGWNGDSAYTIDRIGRGLNLHIPAVCLSLLGSTQPGRIVGYVKAAVQGGERDDGLIQRFGMLVWPDTGGEWRDVDRWPDSAARRMAFEIFDRLDKLDVAALGAQQDLEYDGLPAGVPYLRYADEARELFVEWRVELEAKLRGSDIHPALESHFAKYRKLVSSLALLLHLASGASGPVSHAATLRALAWAEYLETHARRTYASGVSGEVAAATAILTRIRKSDLPREFSRRDVWRPGWTGLADREGVAAALELLVDYGWLYAVQKETGGRTATRYVVNPMALQ